MSIRDIIRPPTLDVGVSTISMQSASHHIDYLSRPFYLLLTYPEERHSYLT